MGIEELNFSSAVLQGTAFSALADLVADLASQTDTNPAGQVGLTYLEMQNLIKSFGFETIANLGRQGKISVSGELFWALPLSEVKKLSTPVVIGTDIARSVLAPENQTFTPGDAHFIDGLASGYADISKGKATTGGYLVNDLSASLGAGYEFPAGKKTDAINWFDLSAVVKAKNIRFDNNSSVTDISAIHRLFTGIEDLASNSLITNELGRSGDRLSDASVAFATAATMSDDFNERDRDYLNFLNLMEPTPSFKDVSQCGIPSVAPYLEAGLFKSVVGYGLNKEYLTNAAVMRNIIRNKVRGSNSNFGVNLVPEFEIMKEYGFPKAKVYEAYADELAFGCDATDGSTRTSTASSYSSTKKESPAQMQEQFASVYGSSGLLADQLSDFQQTSTFGDDDGVKLADVKAASDATSWVGYIEAVKDFINGDEDNTWSSKGIAFPYALEGSKRKIWQDFQEVLTVDPRLAHLSNLVLTPEQDDRLRILLETIANADVSTTAGSSNSMDLSFSYWKQNELTLAIADNATNAPVYIKNKKFYNANTGSEITNSKSIWAAAVDRGWSDATEVYANLKGSGLFMMDNVYNVRSRIRDLDLQSDYTSGLTATVRSQWNDSANIRALLSKDKTDISMGNGSTRHAYEYFTPGHFQDAFFDMNNLQHTANVALRYFDLDTSSTILDDVSKNLSRISDVAYLSLPLKTMDTGVNDTPGSYQATEQQSRVSWLFQKLVKSVIPNSKQALAEITSWRPVPPQLYVDVSDVTGFVEPADRVTNASAAGDYFYNATQGAYDNRNLPGAMVHVMANYLAKASSTQGNTNGDADIIALLDVAPVETLKAFRSLNTGLDTSGGNSGIFTFNGVNIDGDSRPSKMIENVIEALVHYGKPASSLDTIGANADRVINAYESEVVHWTTDSNSSSYHIFGEDSTSVYSMVQHIGYWVPYLSRYSPEDIADHAANDDDIQNISDKARALMFGLLLSATRGTLASVKASDAAVRIAGLNAFHDAGIPKTLVDIAWTARNTNTFANLAGSKYEM